MLLFKQIFEEDGLGDRVTKDAMFDEFAEAAKALANGRRAELVDVLAQGERHVDELANEIGQSVANTSFHLRTLANAGLVTTRRHGTRIYYQLASERVYDLWAAIRDVSAAHRVRLDELTHDYLGNRSRLPQISRDELVRRMDAGDVSVIDVRPRAEYDAGHIAQAISIPIDELPKQVAGLPADLDIVAYCRGPYCAFADDAVRLARRRRRTALRLEDGFPEWRRAGLPTSRGGAVFSRPSG